MVVLRFGVGRTDLLLTKIFGIFDDVTLVHVLTVPSQKLGFWF